MLTTTSVYAGEKEYENLGSSFSPYDEKAFLNELSSEGEKKVCISDNGNLLFNYIVYPDELFSGGTDRYIQELESAVEFLSTALETMTGGETELVSRSQYDEKGGKAFILETDETLDVGNGGYSLNVSQQSIEIKAKDFSSLSGGIYAFLEDKLGCMFVSPEYDYIPKSNTVWVDECQIKHTPSIEWRYVYSYEADIRKNEDGSENYGGWNSKLRLNGAGSNDWYAWVHTSFTYVSPDEYFAEHPEYFSLYRGKRTYKQGPVSGQLCWTNEDVYNIISQKVLQQMRENPDIHIWDVSQMDTWESRGVGCACDKCKEIDEREGSQMGSLLTFINRLADDVAKEFPDNYISTLAYNYTQDPPKNIKPRDNVIIKLCLMPGDCASSYANPNSSDSEKANNLVSDWGKVAKHIVIWDYNIDFHNYLMPYPILDMLKENNDFYIENNVYGIFHQMSADKGGDFSELNSYIFARLMWDKNTDVQEVFNKYLTVYYGNAAPYIAQYYGELDENVVSSGNGLYIYAKPWQYSTSYLSTKNIDKYLEIFENAKQAADDETIIRRVEKAQTGALFSKAYQFSTDMKGRKNALDEFMRICKENNITSLIEGEQNGDELQNFYNTKTREIKSTPFIIAGICLVLIALVSFVVAVILHRKKYGTLLLWKK
uniref:DUF4838 domain-containing protein n=1 Tax=Eubacterium sp. TaxID=142586 RepID=UPI004027209B